MRRQMIGIYAFNRLANLKFTSKTKKLKQAKIKPPPGPVAA
jgi:hypothetical protein